MNIQDGITTQPAPANLNPHETSEILRQYGIRAQVVTLAKWRCLGSDGPLFVRCGHAILYPRATLHVWAQLRLSAPRRSTRGEG